MQLISKIWRINLTCIVTTPLMTLIILSFSGHVHDFVLSDCALLVLNESNPITRFNNLLGREEIAHPRTTTNMYR